MVYACLTPGDTDQFFYKHNSDWWNFQAPVPSFMIPPSIPLPTMIDMVGGDRTWAEKELVKWKPRVPSWRESTRIWSEWFRLVAGCPSPAENEAAWSIFRTDAEDWWDAIASQESETQHRTREFTDWAQGRSFRNKHAQVRRRTTKELDTRGGTINGGGRDRITSNNVAS